MGDIVKLELKQHNDFVRRCTEIVAEVAGLTHEQADELLRRLWSEGFIMVNKDEVGGSVRSFSSEAASIASSMFPIPMRQAVAKSIRDQALSFARYPVGRRYLATYEGHTQVQILLGAAEGWDDPWGSDQLVRDL